MTSEPYVKMQKVAKAGEVIQIKTKLKHPMETGWRENKSGQTVARNRINKFLCTFNGAEVFRADLHSGVSADPYLMFPAKVSQSGVFEFTWFEDGGHEYAKTASIKVG
ncbi:MAG: thiosulfate oxidation carrier complex protein SoxZ [Rhodospirillales bacterium]|nr:thiosulfate oxidation carrier complex protein SoxZ [Rhodospirillales bacterium]